MIRKLKLITLSSVLALTALHAQDKKEQKAEEKFDNYAYSDAIESYEALLKKGYTSEEIYKKLGNANYLNADYDKAADWYGKLFELDGAVIESDYMYKYAQTLKSMKKYEESDQWLSLIHI